ncbi:hypothetical protein [Caproiciproducens sp.]|uniref:hypothetical protein n=1 Tax=Caproiciproducens sp. TaxID=1954376 RepID=UPI00289C200A|nr:hypothetical protein [Caproiciproducens sp.]
MKKIWAEIITLFMCIAFVGCSSTMPQTSSSNIATPSEVRENSSQNSTEDVSSSVVKDLPSSNYKDMGKGTLVIATEGGTSENGKTPVIFLDSGESHSYAIGIHVRDFDGSKLSYVYADGYLISKEQYADEDSSVRVKDDRLAVGMHKIEIVQYDIDKPDGKMITYKSASYEVKSK